LPAATTQALIDCAGLWASGTPLVKASGCPQNRVNPIATSLGISTPTLVKHYRGELRIGKAMMDALAISTLVAAMQRGGKEAVVAAKWWTQARMGWSEKVVMDDGKPGDTPMRIIIELVG
jgi:hypothetical protein